MKFKKVYGSYKTENCVYCGGQSLSKNKLGFALCKQHKDMQETPGFKCFCGLWLDVKIGKYGAYGQCLQCGNQNLDRIREFNANLPTQKEHTTKTVSKQQSSNNTSTKKSTLSHAALEYGLLLDD